MVGWDEGGGYMVENEENDELLLVGDLNRQCLIMK